MKVLLVTGPSGDAQGWGDMEVTKSVCQAIESSGKKAEISYVENKEEFLRRIDQKSFDIVWSSLYHLSQAGDIIGLNVAEDLWVADILDAKGIPYIGSNSKSMKDMIDKMTTHRIMRAGGVAVPDHVLADMDSPLPAVSFPAFVKPVNESRSKGISDKSVVYNPDELKKQIERIVTEFKQPALVEEYLPGDEYTVLMLGNGKKREFFPALVHVEGKHYQKYRILRSDLRGVGITKMSMTGTLLKEVTDLTAKAVLAVNCLDHVRADVRIAKDGLPRIIEVNGIPGLKPLKSWSPQLFTMYHPSKEGPMEDYQRLVNQVVEAGMERAGLV